MELIGLLVKEGLLNVIYTTDGKDIITEQRLIREILDEIYANGGVYLKIFVCLRVYHQESLMLNRDRLLIVKIEFRISVQVVSMSSIWHNIFALI